VRKGINQWSFPPGMELHRCAELAKVCGFEGIELCLEETGELSLETTSEEAVCLARAVSEVGIVVPSIATRLYWKYTPASGDPAVRRRVLDIAKRQAHFARIFGARTMLYLAGSVNDGQTPIRYVVAYERAKEMLAEVARMAAVDGVRVGVENVWNNFLMSPLEMRTFLDEVNSPVVGAYLDTGNALVYGHPEDWVLTLDHWLLMVHFKDFKRDVMGTNGFAPPLTGDVDWRAVMSALAAVRYDGFAIAEFVRPYRYCADQLVRDLSAAMDRILGLET